MYLGKCADEQRVTDMILLGAMACAALRYLPCLTG